MRGKDQEPVGTKQSIDVLEQWREITVQPPRPPSRAVPVRRRIEDDTVVLTTPADLARDERGNVIDEPADRPLPETVERRVPSRPLDSPLRGIDMRDRGARAGEGERHEACIGEKVENRGPVTFACSGHEPRHDPGVFGEQPDLACVRRPELERELEQPSGPPCPGSLQSRPGPAGVAVEPEIRLGPAIRRASGILGGRVRSIDHVLAEPLQPPASADIEQLITVHERIFTGNRERRAAEWVCREGKEIHMARRSILVLVLLVAAAFAACSPSGGSGGGGGGSAAPAASSVPSAVAPGY